MELEEALAALKKAQKSIDTLSSEKTSILDKNQELLGEAKAAKTERNELKTSFETLTAEFDAFKNEQSLGADNMKKVDELVAQKLEKKQSDFDTLVDGLTTELNETKSGFNKLKSKYDNERISSAIRKAAETAKMLPTAIDDAVHRAAGMFSISEEGIVESRDADGNLVKIGKKIASPEVFVESLKEAAPHLWPASSGSGSQGSEGGGSNSVNPFAKDTLNYTEQAKIMKSNPERAAQLKADAAS